MWAVTAGETAHLIVTTLNTQDLSTIMSKCLTKRDKIGVKFLQNHLHNRFTHFRRYDVHRLFAQCSTFLNKLFFFIG